MYLEHYGFQRAPFNLPPDPDCLYLSEKHQLGLSMLQYGLSESVGGLTVITGAVGSGKTTLLHKLLQQLDYSRLNVGVINNTFGFDAKLIGWVVSAFNLPYEAREPITLFREFQQFLIDEYARGKITVLIIDEAQNLDSKALEELRLLTNINAGRDQLLKIVLLGQPELLEILSQPALSQIAQRVSVEYHLEALGRFDAREYIHHRLEAAGGNRDIFSDGATDIVYWLSGGVPRLINTLCDYALVYGYARGIEKIGLTAILESARGRRLGGINRLNIDSPALREIRGILASEHGVDIDAFFPSETATTHSL
jgi:type II secretory pathway predicted ATPase ExeA